MKAKIGMVVLACLFMPLLAGAEPISFEQAANVTGMAGIEVGADVDYAYTKVESGGVTASEQTLTDIPVFVRAGIPILEAKLTLPYGTVKESVGNESFSGIKDIDVMLKTGLLTLPVFSFALGLDTTLPTGDPAKLLGEGLNLDPFVAVGVDAGVLKVHANLGYRYRAEYEIKIDTVTIDPVSGLPVITGDQGVKIKPGDAIHFAVGVEVPAGDMFSLHAELLAANYAEAKEAGAAVSGSSGTLLSVVPGVRMHAGPLKAKLGVEIPLSSKDDWPAYAPVADWRVLGGLSLQFSL
ncbi:MAG: hypothetical protein AB1439_11040 [candidate division FCPU426 bacterium]